MSQQDVFVSYVAGTVDVSAVRSAIEKAGFQFVNGAIAVDSAAAIRDAAYFVACFWPGADGAVAWNCEEVACGIAELQNLRRTREWFLVLKLAPCELPAIDIVASARLADLTQLTTDDLSRLASRVRREVGTSNTINADNVQGRHVDIAASRGSGLAGQTNSMNVKQVIGDDTVVLTGSTTVAK